MPEKNQSDGVQNTTSIVRIVRSMTERQQSSPSGRQRAFPLLSVNKTDPPLCQRTAVAGQKPPAFDRAAGPPSEPKMRAKDLRESARLLARIK